LHFTFLRSLFEDARAARRRFMDHLGRAVATAGGIGTVASILVLLAFLIIEVAPLSQGARVHRQGDVTLAGEEDPLWIVVDEYREFAQVFRSDGKIDWIRLTDGSLFERRDVPGSEGRGIASLLSPEPGQFIYWRADGVLIAAIVGMRTSFTASGRDRSVEAVELGRWSLVPEDRVPQLFAASAFKDGSLAAAWLDHDGSLTWWSVREQRALFGGLRQQEQRVIIARAHQDRIRSMALDRKRTQLVLGTDSGALEVWGLSGSSAQLWDRKQAGNGAEITALDFLLGERAFVAGDSAGRVSVWQALSDERSVSGHRLVQMRELAPHGSAVQAIARSERDRTFLTADRSGSTYVRYSTSGETLARVATGVVRQLAFAPKGDGFLQLTPDHRIRAWALENPHPEATWGTLFGRVWYEGYAEPAYVWQSTGGTDDFEPKLSLVPLIFGTIKGTVYALVFAVPIALLAALYTSQFSPPGLRAAVKPIVEIMAALPSVVLGFVAGLVLAPAIEKHIAGVLVAIPLAPFSVFCAGVLWYFCPSAIRNRLPHGGEVVLAAALLGASAYGFWLTSPHWERWLFGGDFRHWLSEVGLGRFDQRNCLVVGLAMGFAVIPIIFTIAEDALANVPQRLVSASLALGATRWQTALYVVLPTASPGIFSAVMIGFGRAVGETMIVLMATGNTPVLDWSMFTGMRTLSANIAVEIPEAPYGSTLYRVLFLAALLLFGMTFVVNTLAEAVRQRLRERYQRL